MAYSPLCRSLLSGEVKAAGDLCGGDDDLRPSRYPRFAADNLAKNAQLVGAVQKLAADRAVSAAQLSLAWVQSQGDDVVPIPGTTKIGHLDANVDALKVALSKEERAMYVHVTAHAAP